MKRLRCAVYTRKSTEDGLEQEFNSLHAQRDACEAYILSQRHEGWELVPSHYDDGGFSGGNMERPGLKDLLADMEAGKIDVIVVYKVDRLTRNLSDFARIVERLDVKEASFVSVTQAFNTTTSMGRLTLNVLLSFAQFEREVTGERIRDKIAASKKKGLWMGGPVPLGYEVIERKLVPVPEEAERVRTIMKRYIASSSANALIAELADEGVLTKVQRRTSGPHRGGIPFRRGSLFHLLKNPIYRGKIVHKGNVYEGEHEAIVDRDLWEAVQQRLAAKAPPRKRNTNETQDALLKGLLIDAENRPMVPTFTTKGMRRYRYYETRRDLAKSGDAESTRYSMSTLDKHVTSELGSLLGDEHQLRRLSGEKDGTALERVFTKARDAALQLDRGTRQRSALSELLDRILIGQDHIELLIKSDVLGEEKDGCLWRHRIGLPTRKPFREAKLRIDIQRPESRAPDRSLVRILREAAAARKLVLDNPDLSLGAIAKQEGRCRKNLTALLKLGWISPRIVEAILDGAQPKHLSRDVLLSGSLPISWHEQEKMVGVRR